MKTLIITGASKGIGLEVARQCLDAGYRVINFSRTAPPDERIENQTLDLSGPDAEALVKTQLDRLITDAEIVLVHNAAKMTNDQVDTTPTSQLREVLDINLIAPHILNQAVIPKMRPGSSIIYIGSTLAEKAVANTFSYVVSKHALIGMMRATCQDLAGRGIHTSCVCPGFTDTQMLRTHVGNDPDILKAIASLSTFNRLVEPREIAATVKFAAENPVLNGAVIHANLGQVER